MFSLFVLPSFWNFYMSDDVLTDILLDAMIQSETGKNHDCFYKEF